MLNKGDKNGPLKITWHCVLFLSGLSLNIYSKKFITVKVSGIKFHCSLHFKKQANLTWPQDKSIIIKFQTLFEKSLYTKLYKVEKSGKCICM